MSWNNEAGPDLLDAMLIYGESLSAGKFPCFMGCL